MAPLMSNIFKKFVCCPPGFERRAKTTPSSGWAFPTTCDAHLLPMERTTTMKSNTFQPFMKKYCLKANIFRTHSPVKTATKNWLILLRIFVFSSLWSSVSTIIVIMLRQMRTMMLMSKVCLVTMSKTKPWYLFWRNKRWHVRAFWPTQIRHLEAWVLRRQSFKVCLFCLPHTPHPIRSQVQVKPIHHSWLILLHCLNSSPYHLSWPHEDTRYFVLTHALPYICNALPACLLVSKSQ